MVIELKLTSKESVGDIIGELYDSHQISIEEVFSIDVMLTRWIVGNSFTLLLDTEEKTLRIKTR